MIESPSESLDLDTILQTLNRERLPAAFPVRLSREDHEALARLAQDLSKAAKAEITRTQALRIAFRAGSAQLTQQLTNPQSMRISEEEP